MSKARMFTRGVLDAMRSFLKYRNELDAAIEREEQAYRALITHDDSTDNPDELYAMLLFDNKLLVARSLAHHHAELLDRVEPWADRRDSLDRIMAAQHDTPEEKF